MMTRYDEAALYAVAAEASEYAARMTKKRGYSREFTPAPQGHARYLLDKIPSSFWREVKAKAKRDGVSIRALILRLLKEWVER